MGHTPTTPATDDRPLRFLEKAEVPEAHKERLLALVRRAQDMAGARGATDKLQSEFGAEHAALIHDCDQFVRIYKRGEAAGRVELLLDAPAKEALQQAGFTLHAPQGMVFGMLGWVAVEPMEGDLAALENALEAAYARAAGK